MTHRYATNPRSVPPHRTQAARGPNSTGPGAQLDGPGDPTRRARGPNSTSGSGEGGGFGAEVLAAGGLRDEDAGDDGETAKDRDGAEGLVEPRPPERGDPDRLEERDHRDRR